MIRCCYKCARPWKSPYCHCYCPDYVAEKAKHEADKAAERKDIEKMGQLYQERSERVYAAQKMWRKK